MAVNRELVLLLDSNPAGVVREGSSGRLELNYDPVWRDRSDSYPLSLSLPLTRARHLDSAVRPFLEGLLPDNADVLGRWARQFHVSAGNPFALLGHIGEDCAGAVQLVRAERLDDVLGEAAPEVEWLSEMAVARRLTDIVEHHGTGRTAGDPGYFSLAGAQPKTALIYSDGRWGVPSGRLPTTHILKPSTQRDLPGFEVNEHFCLRLAEEVGVPVAESRVLRFDDQIAIVVSRYDRAKLPSGEIRRVHQEDACQALSVSPSRKYEAEGGPGAASLVDLLLEEADDPEVDVGTLIDALALNWVIGGTDAHAKNYSLLIRPGSVRLAPLYDLVSALPYPHWIPYRKAKLAMRVDREYAIHKVRARHWRALAEHCGLDAGPVVDRVGEIVDQVQGATGAVAASLHEEGLNDPIIGDLADAISSHAERCLDHLSA